MGDVAGICHVDPLHRGDAVLEIPGDYWNLFGMILEFFGTTWKY
jgi:hypothetical protein